MSETVNIPIQLCKMTLSEDASFFRAIQVYIYLLTRYSGKVHIGRQERFFIAHDLGLSSDLTVKKAIETLLNSNFLMFSKRSEFYFIIGLDRIRRTYNFNARTAAEFDPDNIRDLKGFMAGAFISYVIHRKRKRERNAALKNKHANTRANKRSLPFYQISSLELASYLKISASKAQRLKRISHKGGFINIKSNSIPTGIHVKEYRNLVRFFDSKFRIRNNFIFKTGPDLIKSNIKLKSRLKLDEISIS